MNRIELINKMEDDIATMLKMAHEIEISIAKLDVVGENVWRKSSQLGRTIISTRKQVAKLKLDEGGYPLHADIPLRIGGQMD